MEDTPAEIIIPSFGRYPKEGTIVGRLLDGYGELELELCNCLAAVTNDPEGAVRTLFDIRGEKARIDKANSLMLASYVSAGLHSTYSRSIENIHSCRIIRNQYAHCHWYDTKDEGLCFIDLEDAAKSRNHLFPLKLRRLPIDEALLHQQEAYFKYTQKCFWHLEAAFRKSNGQPQKRALTFAWPDELKAPPKHN